MNVTGATGLDTGHATAQRIALATDAQVVDATLPPHAGNAATPDQGHAIVVDDPSLAPGTGRGGQGHATAGAARETGSHETRSLAASRVIASPRVAAIQSHAALQSHGVAR